MSYEIIDNLDAGYQEVGSPWLSWSGAGYNNNFKYRLQDTSGDYAEWTSTLNGAVFVYMTWSHHSNRSTNARVEVYDDTTLVDTILLNQELAPTADFVAGGVNFQLLGNYTITGTLTVRLTTIGNEYNIADAIVVQEDLPSHGRVSQAGLEIVRDGTPSVRISNTTLEVLAKSSSPRVRYSTIGLEVVVKEGAATPPSPTNKTTCSCPTDSLCSFPVDKKVTR